MKQIHMECIDSLRSNEIQEYIEEFINEWNLISIFNKSNRVVFGNNHFRNSLFALWQRDFHSDIELPTVNNFIKTQERYKTITSGFSKK